MSADIVNLRQARKAKARAEKDVSASENRVKFGRTKGEKAKDRQEREHSARLLDGSRRDTGDKPK